MFIDVFDTVFENCFDLLACAIAVLLLDCHNQIVKPEKYFLFVAIAEKRRYEFEEKNFKSIVDKRENIVAGCTQNHVVKLEKFVGDFHPVVTVFDVFENAFELFYVIVRAIFCRQISTFALIDAPEFHYGIDGFLSNLPPLKFMIEIKVSSLPFFA